jgi:hypothetical protein
MVNDWLPVEKRVSSQSRTGDLAAERDKALGQRPA